MLKKIIISLSLLALPLLSLADQLKINDNAPKTYIVKKGDTLWDISEVFLDQPWLWPKLWRLNPEINNPHLIYPGDVLKLILDENGEPMLVIDEPVKVELKKVELTKIKPSYKWSPKIRQKVKDDSAIKLLPLNVIAPFIKYDHLFTAEQLEGFPYIIGSNEGYKTSINNFKVYVNKELELAKTYAIYDKGEEIFDPETDTSLGFYVNLAGTAQVLRTGDTSKKVPATLHVNTAKREIRSGYYVVPVHDEQLFSSLFTMRAVDDSFKGAIIKSVNNGREFSKLEVVMINRGSDHNVRLGDVMAIKRQSPAVIESKSGPTYAKESSRWNRTVSNDEDYVMPEEVLGELMVFKIYPKASMALILHVEKPARLLDIVAAPN